MAADSADSADSAVDSVEDSTAAEARDAEVVGQEVAEEAAVDSEAAEATAEVEGCTRFRRRVF